ncbi:hypothetical protein [Lentilactobacillus parabuchneri]|nr:hypothetical protein [Lentilactobacillus parabuchneri]
MYIRDVFSAVPPKLNFGYSYPKNAQVAANGTDRDSIVRNPIPKSGNN